MANLPESNTFPAGVYQIELTDPVVGGVDGVSNAQARQLANRTRWLKNVADEVIAARGGDASLSERLADYDAFAPEQQTTIIAGVLEALGLAGALAREMQTLRQRVFAQGVVTIRNKHVISGFVLVKGDIRALHLTQSGALSAGVSYAQLDGVIVSLPDDDYHVSVPTNETNEPRTYFAYLVSIGDRAYGVEIAPEVPPNGLPLYRLDVPSHNTGDSLSAIAMTDVRVVQSSNAWVSTFDPFAAVAFPAALPAADYGVALEIESATSVAAVGTLEAYDRATNGFKIRMTGSADNVRVRWSLLNIRYQ